MARRSESFDPEVNFQTLTSLSVNLYPLRPSRP